MTTLAHPRAHIGPNAITRVAEALGARDDGTLQRVFRAAGLAAYLAAPPTAMVRENEVIALHRALRAALGADDARRVAREAGRRTADYVIAHRMPRLAVRLLPHLPVALAGRLLLAAITRHAWTFAGSGRFAVATGRPWRVSIQDNPLCRGLVQAAPQCDYYAATFERLFRRLVDDRLRVVELACEASGAPACLFEIARPRA